MFQRIQRQGSILCPRSRPASRQTVLLPVRCQSCPHQPHHRVRYDSCSTTTTTTTKRTCAYATVRPTDKTSITACGVSITDDECRPSPVPARAENGNKSRLACASRARGAEARAGRGVGYKTTQDNFLAQIEDHMLKTDRYPALSLTAEQQGEHTNAHDQHQTKTNMMAMMAMMAMTTAYHRAGRA